MDKAVLIDIVEPNCSKKETELRLEELNSLVKTYGGITVENLVQKRAQPAYKTYVGSGKLEELLDSFESFDGLDVVVINNILKPRQIYNLEEFCINYQIKKRKEDRERFEEEGSSKTSVSRWENPKKIKVWDRVDLILKIFDKHASTVEAKLQIELASIKHMGPRIFGMGLELSRQAGGIGTVGVGETNTQIMKRHLQKRQKLIEKKIQTYSDVQKRHRDSRRNKNFKTIALVGYTNAGKSTLKRSLTKKQNTYVADELFATLDSTVGELFLPQSRTKMIVADTIGFIQDLPPDLIDAFKSTLAEIIEADIIFHVIDTSDENILLKIQVVEEIMAQLDVSLDKDKYYIFNKMDKLEDKSEREELIQNLKEQFAEYNPVFISATDKSSLHQLIADMDAKVAVT
ncbi:MAG: GTPase HflX [Candidatus Caenarcaniphilales bacterium]|nr:GTPase HflX [Candidatus Caenarcaniphilales bacterium]